jgi:ABC-2 type transport system ATP-binding protein
VRNFVRLWMNEDRSRSLLLTTHYMVEAEELCDRVAIISRGRVLACDTPASLRRNLQKDALFSMETSPLDGGGDLFLRDHPGVRQFVHRPADGLSTIELRLENEDALGGVLQALTSRNVRLLNLRKREPTLEDVFVHLVGRSMEEVERAGP